MRWHTKCLLRTLARPRNNEKTFYDYRTFDSQYQEAVGKIPSDRFSEPYIKCNIKDAEAILNVTSSSASLRGKPKNFPAKADYRLVWPALVFQMAWVNKDHKTKSGAGTVCFIAAGFMLEATLNNIARRRVSCLQGSSEGQPAVG